MGKQFLSIEHMKHLEELGVDTSKASMCWCTFNGDTTLSVHNDYCYESASLHPIPAFTLQDVLDLLPKEIKSKDDGSKLYLEIVFPNDDAWEVTYGHSFHVCESFFSEFLIDAAYDMLCWCIENGYIK